MMKKSDTPAEDQTEPSRAHDDDEQERKSGSAWLLLLAVAVIGGGLWTVDRGYVDHLLYPDEQEPAIALPPSPSASVAPPKQMPPVQDSRHDTSALRASEDASRRERAQLRRDVERMGSDIKKLNENINTVMQSIEEMQEMATPFAAATTLQPDSADTEKLREQVTSLSERLERLQQDYSLWDGRYTAQLELVQLADTLARKAAAGEPFAKEMRRLQQLAVQLRLDAGTVEILQAHAQEGIYPLSALIRQFGETAQTALPYSLGKERSLSDNLRSNLAHVISIRKIEVEAADESDEAHIARAEAELRAGNVDMALTHLEQLSEQPRRLFSGWQGQAREYLDVHHAIESLKTVAMQRSGME